MPLVPYPKAPDKYILNTDNMTVYDRSTGKLLPASPQQAEPQQPDTAVASPTDPFMKGIPQSQQGAMQQMLGAQDPFQNEPGPIDYKAGALAALSGGTAGLAESTAMKALPFMAARTAPAAVARGVAAGIGSELPYAVKDIATGQGIDPLNTAFNVATGTLGGVAGSAGERTVASTKEARQGGGQGLMTKVANRVMDIVGLPSIKPPELEKMFTAGKPVGINQPQTEASIFQKYSDGPYKQTTKQVEQLWPAQGMASPQLDTFAKEYGPENLSVSAREKYENHQQTLAGAQAQLAAANAMPSNTAALFQAKQAKIQAAQQAVQTASGPPLYTLSDINKTAEKLRDEGFKVVGEGPKEGGSAKVARQKAHEITDSLVDNIKLLDPALAQQYANDRVNLRRLDVFTDLMQHSLSGDNAGIAKMIHKYFLDPETRNLMKVTFGENENEIAQLLSRGFITPKGEGNVAARHAADTLAPDQHPFTVRGHLLEPHKWNIIERISNAVPRLLRPEAQPYSIAQLLQTGIPVAAAQLGKDKLLNPNQEDQ